MDLSGIAMCFASLCDVPAKENQKRFPASCMFPSLMEDKAVNGVMGCVLCCAVLYHSNSLHFSVYSDKRAQAMHRYLYTPST